VPTFCRHNRFIERCPICSKTLPGRTPATGGGRRASRGAGAGLGAGGSGAARGSAAPGARHRRLRAGGREVRVHREVRSEDDGYRSALAPGLHSSGDATRLANEIAFASGRLLRLHAAPPDLFNEIRSLADDGPDGLERATWTCFLTVYLSPLQGEDPFAGVRLALERSGGDGVDGHDGHDDGDVRGERDGGHEGGGEGGHRGGGDIPSLEGIPLGPRTSHEPARGAETLLAYRHWAEHAGSQALALVGDESWTSQRRFERAFERLALPGFGRMGRYELLVTLGRLGLYELQADSLHLTAGRGAGPDDLTTVAAKRILAVGDPIYLERRALAFAQELSVEVDVLHLAFANWGAGERATLGFKPDIVDSHALERASDALGL
jgi:Alpha-glutamyl/putrescinyl thymine pyrophosphorylase clade 3